MSHPIRLLALVIVLAAILVACGGPGASSPAVPEPSHAPSVPLDADGVLQVTDGSAGGPGISVEEAVAHVAAEPLLVNGALFVDPDGSARLCSAIAESFPPQCGGTRLVVAGLDPATVVGLQEANGVRWAERVQLFGTVTPAAE